jgi:hypothetical protein
VKILTLATVFTVSSGMVVMGNQNTLLEMIASFINITYNTTMMVCEYNILKEDVGKAMSKMLIRGLINTIILIYVMIIDKKRGIPVESVPV